MPRPRIDRPSLDSHSDRGYRVSIVIPVYRGEKTIERLVRTLLENLGSLYALEIVLVNDGSPDDSASVCRRLATELPLVKFLGLSKNYREHNAVMAGLNHARGDYVAIMDDDFQNPPGEVVKLVSEAQRGFDVVYSYYAVKQHHVPQHWQPAEQSRSPPSCWTSLATCTCRASRRSAALSCRSW